MSEETKSLVLCRYMFVTNPNRHAVNSIPSLRKFGDINISGLAEISVLYVEQLLSNVDLNLVLELFRRQSCAMRSKEEEACHAF